MNRYNLMLIIISFFYSFNNHAQDKLFAGGESFNVELEIIERLVHGKIDSLRKRKKLNELTTNEYLTKAALLHASWMQEKNKFSHIQNKSKTKTPQRRVELVGGNGSTVGENIAYTLYNIELKNKKGKTYINQSCEAIANDLVQMWRHSKGHYKNIMTKDFEATGIALSVDFEQNKIYAVQVFGGN